MTFLWISLYALGLGLGPIVDAPISLTRGCKAVYLPTLQTFLAFIVGAGLARKILTLIVHLPLPVVELQVRSPALAVCPGRRPLQR